MCSTRLPQLITKYKFNQSRGAVLSLVSSIVSDATSIASDATSDGPP